MRIRSHLVSAMLLAAWFRPAFSQTGNPPDQPVLHGGTHVVLVNVVVRDKHGKPVEDLTRDDFVLRDNGQERKISLFALEKSSGKATATPDRRTFTNRPAAASAGVVAFLFDELNTSLADQQLAKKDFAHYLQSLPADSRVAVFVLGDSLTILHDFTQDIPSLLTALGKHVNRVNPEVSAATAPPASSNSLTGDPTSTRQWDSFLKASNQRYVDYTETVRATRTAAALQIIASHLEGIPGRKTLVWISGGFPIQVGLRNRVDAMAQGNSNNRQAGRGGSSGRKGSGGQSAPKTPASNSNTGGDLPGTGLSYVDDVQRAIQALNAVDIAVYPVDARGVMVAPIFQANRGSIGNPDRPHKAALVADYNFDTLQELAVETGGKAYRHMNDLSSAIQDAIGDARVSYSLAFAPPAESLDGSYHRIEVTVKREGTQLRYRPGYVAAPGEAAEPTLAQAIANPIALGGIGLSVHLDPVDGGYKASVTVDPRNITLEPKDWKWIGALQFLVVVGKTEQLTTIPLSFDETTYRSVQSMGLVLGARVKTPPVTTGFSLGFRDMPSGLIGTLHVPL